MMIKISLDTTITLLLLYKNVVVGKFKICNLIFNFSIVSYRHGIHRQIKRALLLLQSKFYVS
jgi:hypothetical protein